MLEEFSGELAPALRDALGRLQAAPGVSGVFIVVFSDDFKRSTVANTIPKDLAVGTLKAVLEVMEPRRILIPT